MRISRFAAFLSWHGRIARALAVVLLIASPAIAKEMPGAKELLNEQVASLDREIAQRMLRRPQTASEKMPRLDMEIDLRIVARWFLAQAAAQKEANEVQVSGRLRGQLALEAIAGVEDVLNRQREKLTLGQVEGMSRLHALSFKLDEAKGTGSLDDVSRQLAEAVLLIAGPGMPDARLLPPMRPKVPSAGRAPAQRSDLVNVPSIADRIPGLNVSVPLRQQLTLLAAAALSDKEKDPAAVAKTLGTAFELAAALQNNVAAAPDARVRMETQLAEGIVLFLDPRTRSAGQARISDLNEYRKIVERIAGLRLSADEHSKYAPIFAWAQREAEGVRALAALERFVQNRERAHAREALPTTPIPNLRHSVEDLEKRYAAAQSDFDAAFDELIKSTGGTGAEALEARAGEMSQALDLLEKLDQMPATLDALASLKPKPYGGIERRIVTAAVAISSNGPEKAESLKLLDGLHRLARLTSELNGTGTAELSGALNTKYAGGQLPQLEAKWRSLAEGLASSIASGAELDAGKMSRLATAKAVYDALRDAAGVEASIAASDALYRWIDWRMSSEDLAVVFQPYQEALAAAVGAYVADAPKPLEEWSKVERRYRPLVSLVNRARAFQRDVQALPQGLVGAAAALLTPCDKAPFATERHLSFAVAVCKSHLAADDQPSASEVLDILLKRLQK